MRAGPAGRRHLRLVFGTPFVHPLYIFIFRYLCIFGECLEIFCYSKTRPLMNPVLYDLMMSAFDLKRWLARWELSQQACSTHLRRARVSPEVYSLFYCSDLVVRWGGGKQELSRPPEHHRCRHRGMNIYTTTRVSTPIPFQFEEHLCMNLVEPGGNNIMETRCYSWRAY